jgi:hypothetical protein
MDLLPNDDQVDTIDPNKEYLPELVGEGKKYKDPEALAKSRLYADEHIRNLEAEKAELLEDHLKLREEYNKALNLQELLDRLEAKQSTVDYTNQNTENNREPLKMDELENFLETKLNARDAKRREEENAQIVQRKLEEHFGSDFNRHLKSQAESLGMTAEEVNKMARTNPKAFERLFLATPTTDLFQAPPASTQRSTTFAPSTTKRDWKYYEKMKVDQPDVYWQPKTQQQMVADAKALGDAFG